MLLCPIKKCLHLSWLLYVLTLSALIHHASTSQELQGNAVKGTILTLEIEGEKNTRGVESCCFFMKIISKVLTKTEQ